MSVTIGITGSLLADAKDASVRRYLNAVITIANGDESIGNFHLSSWDISKNSLKTRTMLNSHTSFERATFACNKKTTEKCESKSGRRIKIEGIMEVYDEAPTLDEAFEPLSKLLKSKRITTVDVMKLRNTLNSTLERHLAETGMTFEEKISSKLEEVEDFTKIEESQGIGVETKKINANWGMF